MKLAGKSNAADSREGVYIKEVKPDTPAEAVGTLFAFTSARFETSVVTP
jgi:hypothetical protein